MSLLLIVPGWNPAPWVRHLSEEAPNRKLQVFPDAVSDPSAVEYALAWAPPKDFLATVPDLKVIFSLGAGVDHLMSDPNLPDVPVVRVVDDSLTRRMTEWVVMQVLMQHRRQPLYSEQQRRHEWRGHTHPLANEVRVGILGLGELGRDAASMLRHIGYQVAGWSRSEKSLDGVACFHGAEQLVPFLARTDILVSLLPLTPETTGFLNYDLFAGLARDGRLKAPALINAGRGKSQVEADIVRALDDGTLSGASLDVFETEPLPQESPLWDHPRVVITPHAAAESDPRKLAAYVLSQIETYESGGELMNVVDRVRGY